MGLVTSDPIRVDVPHDPGQWMEFVKLGWRALREARKGAEAEQREIAKSFGAEFVRELSRSDIDEEAQERALERLQARQYRESNYDRASLLQLGVVGWSYGVPVTPEALDSLEERDAAWAAQTIIDLVKPETESDRKNA